MSMSDDNFLSTRPMPDLGKIVYTYAINVRTSGDPLKGDFRAAFEYTVIQARVFSHGPGGTDANGQPIQEIWLEPGPGMARWLDSYDTQRYRAYGYIVRSDIGWFESGDEARARVAYLTSIAPDWMVCEITVTT